MTVTDLPACPAIRSAGTPPTELVSWVRDALDALRPGQFLLVEYLTGADVPVAPYAQAALQPDGWFCELVSERYLGAREWPLDESALLGDGWRSAGCPGAASGRFATGNWWRSAPDPSAAAALLVSGLWAGRSCQNVDAFALSTGTFPCPPDRVRLIEPGAAERA